MVSEGSGIHRSSRVGGKGKAKPQKIEATSKNEVDIYEYI